VSYRRLALLALIIASAPASASAQFTTFIPPQSKVKDSVKAAVVAEQRARSDSMTAASVTNMRTWVDSAAGVVAPTTAADSLTRAVAESTTFRNGSPAPMTASSLPLLLLLGVSSLSAGALLLVRPTRRHRA
jgi:hypothetical protein